MPLLSPPSPIPSILHSSPLLEPGALHGQGHPMQNAATTATQSAFQSTAIYREILEKALSDSMTNAARERAAAATKIKKLSQEKQSALSKLKKAASALSQSEQTNVQTLAEGRELVSSLQGRVRELEGEIERVKREGEELLYREKQSWLLTASEEKRELTQSWVEAQAAKDLSISKDRETSAARIETTEKALAEARHLIHHLEETAENLRQEVFEAVELKHKAEASTTAVQASFSKYRRMVGDAMEGTKDFSHERRRSHSSMPASELRQQLKRAMSLESLSETHSIYQPRPPLPTSPVLSSPARISSDSAAAPASPAQPSHDDSFRTPPSSPSRTHRTNGTTGTPSIETPSLTRSANAPSESEASIESPRPHSQFSTLGHGATPAERKAIKEGRIHKILRRITSPHPSPSSVK